MISEKTQKEEQKTIPMKGERSNPMLLSQWH